MSRFWLLLTACSFFAAVAGVPASAGWSITYLHPDGATESQALGVSYRQQVGYAVFSGVKPCALLWTGSADSYWNLNPAGATASVASGVSGSQQVGVATIGSYDHAALWTGTADSWVDLHPSGARSSGAYGVSDGQQAGYAYFTSSPWYRAALWTGTANSYINRLSGATASGISGQQQVGRIIGNSHAGLWIGAAGDWIDLNPAGATESEAYGVSGDQQVGAACVGGSNHAGLWTGTALSWADLNPVGATSSRACGVHGGVQVGEAMLGGSNHAALWYGTATGFVDLGEMLPAGAYTSSSAGGIYTSGGSMWIVGYAVNATTGKANAVMWTYTPPGMSVGAAKRFPPATRVHVINATVTATDTESGSVFVESSDRAAGIKLVTEETLSVGQKVEFKGTVDRIDGEYQVRDVEFTSISPGMPLSPVCMTTATMANDRTGSLSYEGINTTGMLVRFTGEVRGVSSAQHFIYVDDGACREDGVAMVPGVRVHVPGGVTLPAQGSHVVVTGISRVGKFTMTGWPDLYVPSVWVRDANDLQALP